MAKDFDTFPGFTDFRSLKPLKQQHFQKSSTLEQGRVNALHFAYESHHYDQYNNTFFNMATEM
ncbi:hypothetical protein I314_02962, partial [Cryptococcus bacillisporus CA1873]